MFNEEEETSTVFNLQWKILVVNNQVMLFLQNQMSPWRLHKCELEFQQRPQHPVNYKSQTQLTLYFQIHNLFFPRLCLCV